MLVDGYVMNIQYGHHNVLGVKHDYKSDLRLPELRRPLNIPYLLWIILIRRPAGDYLVVLHMFPFTHCRKRVLRITDGIDDLGGMQWELLGCLVLGWGLVYLIIWRGLHASGKVRL
jgi:hypothetical protein